LGLGLSQSEVCCNPITQSAEPCRFKARRPPCSSQQIWCRRASHYAGRVAASLKRSRCCSYHRACASNRHLLSDDPAPISDVYAALVDPEALSAWVPPGDMTGTIERFEPHPGGSYRMVLRYPEHSPSPGKTTSDTDVIEAHFTELVPNERVVYSVNFESDDPTTAKR